MVIDGSCIIAKQQSELGKAAMQHGTALVILPTPASIVKRPDSPSWKLQFLLWITELPTLGKRKGSSLSRLFVGLCPPILFLFPAHVTPSENIKK